ncbi:uncharacterized protein [Paramormyrops kingsleyae]|uniref:Si:dkey-261l7.2 n=2 Tax=Paramormyrops kingsleyae TaxID=1676925 RepID=A0A3B3QRM5_9TELE|nr:uncharacterized protein LOC111841282 isoform X1 [Paramormyrops kingsleyae]XP_023662678.1 uncharacterized protein LOC111841282 isoform X1 [Paramormyrops kingsleyae]XP_023662679.1 uncharacterized protein LOC111841282 isoform X1 [Paramormyrops kingsleyae]
MPRISPVALLQITLLLSALPVQFLISKWTGTPSAERHRATMRLLRVWNDLKKHHLNVTAWTDWAKQWISTFLPAAAEEQLDPLGESPALEVLLYDNNQGYFGASREVRSPRPAYVLHRVGQVVMAQGNHMVGVIVSWDEKLKAPQEWIQRMYSEHELQKVEDTPHYKVIFNGPGPSSILVGYLPQTSLKLFTGFKPDIPTLNNYFSHFDGERFVMKPWLQELFPED